MNVNMNVDSENSNQQTMKYKDVVDKIRHIISKYHSAELIDVIYSPSAGDTLKNLIIRYINQNRIAMGHEKPFKLKYIGIGRQNI